MRTTHRGCLVLSVVILSLSMIGCGGGSSRLKVQGKVVNNGTPYTHRADTETFQVTFRSAGEQSQSFTPAVDEATGTFTLLGSDGTGIPPGTYTIEVTSLPYGPPKPGSPQGDRFKTRYTGAKSPLKVEIKPDTRSITIDVGAGTVTPS